MSVFRKVLILWLVLGLSGLLQAQVHSSIGLSAIPPDSATICSEPYYLGSFYSTGYTTGDTVPDFKLYSLNNDSLELSDVLAEGKPVLLVAGSLTCPVFRGKVARINQVASVYDTLIRVFVIYTIEAHPTDTSVYFGYISTGAANIAAGITFPSPLNYGERKHLADTMAHWVNLNVPMFIDGPCNNWWKHFGPAPNNSYLIDPSGVVRSKHGWFDKAPDNIFCDLDSILGFNSGLCNQGGNNGSFSIHVINAMSLGSPGNSLYNFVDIINTSPQSCSILIRKLQKDLPNGWQSSFCADICYSPGDDSVVIVVPALDTMHFSLDFITGTNPDSGRVKVGFRNVNNTSNAFSIWLSASTLPISLAEVPAQESTELILYPNPSADIICFESGIDLSGCHYQIRDMLGRPCKTGVLTGEFTCIDVKDLPPSTYLILLDSLPATQGRFIRN